MGKTELWSGVLFVVFIIMLIASSIIVSNFFLFSFFFSIILGLVISIFMINKTTKSKNSLRLKIYFTIILSFFISFLVWFSYINSNVVKQDEFGFLTLFIVLPSILIALIISTLTGIILSIKRKSREDFDYNIKRLSWIFSILLVLFIFFSIYDFLISSIAISTSTKVVCYLRIGENRANDCLLKIATEESATEEITCGELDNKKDRNDCYRWTAQNRGDIKICIDNAEAETEVLIYNDICFSAIRDLDEEIYGILENPKHQEIIYAIKSVEYSLGICYGDERKAIPLLKNIVLQGNLESKQEALNILIDNAYCLGGNTLEGEKEFLRNNVLPLIQNQTGLQDYVNKINMVLSSKTLEPSEIEVNPDSKTAPKL